MEASLLMLSISKWAGTLAITTQPVILLGDANDILTVSGNADITTNNYTQSGAITVDGVWTINALTDFTYSNCK